MLTLRYKETSFEQSDDIEITKEQADLFENIHYQKIDMSDEIFVIDVKSYIGGSTKKEIDYAKRNGQNDTILL